MTATKVTTKPPSEEVLRARDDFYDFCVIYGQEARKTHEGMAQRINVQEKIANVY